MISSKRDPLPLAKRETLKILSRKDNPCLVEVTEGLMEKITGVIER